LFGPVEQVRGRVNTFFPERTSLSGEKISATVDDNAMAVLEWPGRMLATVRANWCSPSDHRNVICETRIYGTSGMIFINPASQTNPLIVFSPERPIANSTSIEWTGMSNCYVPDLPPPDQDAGILLAFAEQIAAGASVAADGSNALRQRHVIEVIDRIYASSASGQALTIGGPN
jgi:predicted dehydrogenase